MNKCTKKNCPMNAETLNPNCDLKGCPYRTEVSGDLISRQEAINELKLAYFNKDLQSAKDDPCIVDAMTDWVIRTIKRLPSVTPSYNSIKTELDCVSREDARERLSLEEAIEYCEEVAEEKEKEAYAIVAWIGDYDNLYYNSYRECAEEHRQLAEWLRELKAYREAREEIQRKANSGQWSDAVIYGLSKATVIIDKCLFAHNVDGGKH